MNIFSDFDFKMDRELVFMAIDCHKDSGVYEEVCETYNILLKEFESIVEPKSIFQFKNKPIEYNMEDVKDCSHIVYCMLTLGKKVTEKTETYFSNGDYLEGMLWDAMGDVLLNECSTQLYQIVAKEALKNGFGLTCKLSPGNAEFSLSNQGDILKILNGRELLGVDITESFMLSPVKSVSFIFGADKSLGIPTTDHECSRCTSTNCKMRKETYKDKSSKDIVNLTVINGDKSIKISAMKSKSILNTLIENDIKIKSPCAGNGTCGKCKVRLIDGKVKKLENNSELNEELLKKGWCLACSSYLEEDCIISLNNEEKGFNILDTFENSQLKVKSIYNIKEVEINKDKIKGRSVANIINERLNTKYTFNLKSIKKLGSIINSYSSDEIRESLKDEEIFNIVVRDNIVADVCKLEDTKIYGVAVDIGTTTIALMLINLLTGEQVKSFSILNSQSQFGADVISRIQYSNEGNLQSLKQCIKDDLLSAIKELCKMADIESEKIYEMVISGNTTMLYFLLGLPCESLAVVPFNTITTELLEYNFEEIFNTKLLTARVTFLPGVSAYVGADIVSGMLQCGFNELEKTSILIDVGTNGEMIIGNKDKILCLATAAGPAFEGANITCGIGSVNGAICSVDIRDGKVSYETISNEEPQGICGSAVIDLAACLVNNSIIDETGRFNEEEYESGYIKITENNRGEAIIFNQKDVREMQLAKSAIRSGIEILIKEFNCSYEDIDTVFLAGGFGNHMNVNSAATIGLIPEDLVNKVKCVGNSSLGGAVSYLLNVDNKNILSNLLGRTKYIDISTNSSFNDMFVDNMLF